jgi:hypothetical protein
VTKVKLAKIVSSKPVRKSQVKKVFRTLNGRRAAVYAIDAASKNFDADLVRVFKSNIDRARQANTAIFGSPDGPKES